MNIKQIVTILFALIFLCFAAFLVDILPSYLGALFAMSIAGVLIYVYAYATPDPRAQYPHM